MELVAADIGGTHARFALAEVAGGRVVALGDPVTLKTADHASLALAWAAFGRMLDRPLPRAAAIALATPIAGEVLKLTNNPWVIRPALVRERLGVEDFILVNDFGAVAHAVSQLGADDLRHLAGPDAPLPDAGTISVVGPGTGLGVALVLRRDGRAHVVETEGGHVDFAPLDAIEDALLRRLRLQHRRVSAERIACGSGLLAIYATLAGIERRPAAYADDRALWAAALDGSDPLAVAALDRFCMILGAVAGDVALSHGAGAVVVAGGLGLRLADRLPSSGFAERFAAKGRFEAAMARLPVKLLIHPQPGLLGAAAAFAARTA